MYIVNNATNCQKIPTIKTKQNYHYGKIRHEFIFFNLLLNVLLSVSRQFFSIRFLSATSSLVQLFLCEYGVEQPNPNKEGIFVLSLSHT